MLRKSLNFPISQSGSIFICVYLVYFADHHEPDKKYVERELVLENILLVSTLQPYQNFQYPEFNEDCLLPFVLPLAT